MSADETVRTLESVHAIARLKSRYIRLLDDRDWTRLRALLAADLRFRHPALGELTGADAAITAIAASVQDVSGAHYLHNAEIDVTGDTAVGRWAVHSFVRSDDGEPRQRFARYVDRFRFVDERWQITSIALERALGGPVARSESAIE